MKAPTHRQRVVDSRARWKQILCAGLVGAAALLAAGCRKSAQSPPPTPQTTNASQSVSPAASESQPAAMNSSHAQTAPKSNAAPDLRPLNSALLDWRMQHRRVPANFEEFAASANIKIPPPPPGKKYIINGKGLISLVNAK